MSDDFFAAAGLPDGAAPGTPPTYDGSLDAGFGPFTIGVAITPIDAAAAFTGATSYSATGLPDGLSIHTGTGAISGTPTMEGDDYLATITGTNDDGSVNAPNIAFEIVHAVPVAAEGLAAQDLDLNVAMTPLDTTADFTVDSDATHAASTFSLDETSDPLPAGLSLVAGVLSGTPTEETAATLTIVVKCENSGGSDTTSFDLDVVFEATGGTVVDYTASGTPYRAHILAGTTALTVVRGIRNDGECELIGGGGSGSGNGGGAGSAGDRKVLTGLELSEVTGSYAGSTGAAGASINTAGANGNDGGATTMFGQTANGGKGGATVGQPGLSGTHGSGAGWRTVAGTLAGGATTGGGNDGGDGFGSTTNSQRGGGGGAGEGGPGGNASSGQAGAGGAGVDSDFATGSNAKVCGGGGGACAGPSAVGSGTDGGGNGGSNAAAPTAASTAGSGGGGRSSITTGSNAGAAGRRIVRYPRAA